MARSGYLEFVFGFCFWDGGEVVFGCILGDLIFGVFSLV